jgi:alkylation response protein AidB-like acyl-CoA dehydrogenase
VNEDFDATGVGPARLADRFAELVGSGLLDLPLPGGGRTWERLRGLADVAAGDLSLARLAEGHADALAIADEARIPAPDGHLGVWAADPPDGRLQATRGGSAWALHGRKRWCSGAELLDAALVTAHSEDGYRLFTVRLDQPGVSVSTADWRAVGMRDSVTADVEFDGVRIDAGAQVGGPGWYLERQGFWAGGIGVAACWYGGARGGRERLAAKLQEGRDDPHALAELGAAGALCDAMRAQLHHAAHQLDAGVAGESLQLLAWTVRSGIERLCREVLPHLERGLGAGTLTRDPAAARRVADLPVYLRQHHGGRDLEGLGRAMVAMSSTPTGASASPATSTSTAAIREPADPGADPERA